LDQEFLHHFQKDLLVQLDLRDQWDLLHLVHLVHQMIRPDLPDRYRLSVQLLKRQLRQHLLHHLYHQDQMDLRDQQVREVKLVSANDHLFLARTNLKKLCRCRNLHRYPMSQVAHLFH
jgi:hypothetical protein